MAELIENELLSRGSGLLSRGSGLSSKGSQLPSSDVASSKVGTEEEECESTPPVLMKGRCLKCCLSSFAFVVLVF